MIQLLNTFPLQFQIAAIAAAGLFLLSWILLFCKRGGAMIAAAILSALVYFFCVYSVPDDFVVPVIIVHAVLAVNVWVQFKLYTKAKEQLRKERQLYSSEYETVPADPEEFTWLDIDWYDAAQRELESLGFYKVRDSEQLPLTRVFPETRNFARDFNHAEQDIYAVVFQIRIVKPKDKVERNFDCKIVGLSAEFSDGTFLETSNTLGVNPVHEVEGIVIKLFPPDTPLEKLLDAHENEIENICETKNVEVVLHRTAEELTAAAKRNFLLLCKDRQKKGGLFTAEEIDRNAAILAASAPGGADNKGAAAYYAEYKRQTRKFLRREREERIKDNPADSAGAE